MRSLALITLFLSLNASGKVLRDVEYHFEREKLASTTSTFSFFRSFADYYYVLLKGNLDLLPGINASKSGGWCAGDAHPENFGAILLEDNTSVFTINDLDDAGPCPLAMDVSRFLVSALFANTEANLPKILQSYSQGLDGTLDCPGHAVNDLLEKSQRRGRASNDDEIVGGKLPHGDNGEEVDTATRAKLKTLLTPLIREFSILDAEAMTKKHGGSEGIPRFRLLIQIAGDEFILELKGQVAPAITSVATSPVPNTKDRIAQTLLIEQGSLASRYYGVVTFEGMDYFVRPRFRGNLGIKLADSSAKEVEHLLECEANRLGLLHKKSLKQKSTYKEEIKNNADPLIQDARTVNEFFTKKYRDLGQQPKDTIPPL
jgi:hypothetical protein